MKNNTAIQSDLDRENNTGSDRYYHRDEYDSFYTYLNEIAKIPLLTSAEERELAIKTRNGDEEARNKFIASNLKLVVSIANKYIGLGLPVLDLIEEGNIGLIKAVDKYDPNKGFRFSTYATWLIRHTVKRVLSNKSRTIKVPVHILDNCAKYEKLATKFYVQHGRYPLAEEAAEIIGVSADTINNIAAEKSKVDNLMEEISRISDIEHIPDPNSINSFEKIELSDLVDELLDPLTEKEGNLTEKEGKILKMCYGIGDNRPKTLEYVGSVFNNTRKGVRQIQKRALAKVAKKAKTREIVENI